MAGSPLDFINSEVFRKKLMTRNLTPYAKSPRRVGNRINYEVIQGDVSVQDSPDQLIDNPTFANRLYPLNEWGAEGGFKQVPDPTALLNTKSNKGEYGPGQQDAKILDQALPESKKWKKVNVYGDATNEVLDSGTFITQLDTPKFGVGVYNNQPYYTFVPSSYAPVGILLSRDPQGSDGLLSQDSYIAKLGATILRKEFETRIATRIRQETLGRVNAFNVRSGTDVLGLVTGRIPIIEPNYQITVPANPVLAATDFILRLAGSIIPTSPIPGSYFDPSINSGMPTTIQQLSNAYRRQTATGLASTFTRLLGAPKSGSQLFLNNTGGGQKSRLFGNLNFNKYKPDYDRSIFDRVGGQLVGTIQNNSNFYVGSVTSDPSRVFSPGGDIPINQFGQEEQTPVYGPSELASLYEGNSKEIKLGANGPAYTNGGGIEGGFTWVSPKYRGNAGKKVGIGGEVTEQDEDFKPSSYNNTESTTLELKKGSILDNTQRLINSQPQGGRRLQHVGNAIDQVSKVFNDGYNELTKGSRVIRYVGAIGQEVGSEYCRVFAKDIPYLQYNDLQKTDGMTTEGRKFAYSVLDKTYNLNMYPNKREGGQDSTNLINDSANGVSYAKKYMFSLENLAWRTSATPGFSVSELPICERGPNGGRVMWFPPYGLQFNESVSANWKPTDFLGRPEPVYTYTNSQRSGTIQWKIVVDHPSILNMIVNKVMNKENNKNKINSMIDAFFAGCLKYDLYELAKKYYTVAPGELNQLQQLISGKELSTEQLGFVRDSVATGAQTTGNQSQVVTDPNQSQPTDNLKEFVSMGFYFDNAQPPEGNVSNYSFYYGVYEGSVIGGGNKNYSGETFKNFFNSVIKKNFDEIKDNFVPQLKKILENKNVKVTMTLVGSASSAGSTPYNTKLSERRIQSVIQYLSQDSVLKKAIDSKTLEIKQKAEGSSSSIKKWNSKDGRFTEETYNCASNTYDNPAATDNAQIYNIEPMSCRRVRIDSIVIGSGVPTQQPSSANQPAGGSGTQPITPIPKQDLETKAVRTDNITKRVLRALLSECDYFETIKEETPMVYDSLKEKLKFFQPAFHSTTPEGLNSRLTFLQQCMRPGDTIPTVKQDGNGKQELQFNNATNTSFGVPPVLVLRIGDFYNTKIIPTSLSLNYEALDLNPEGIGVQPMIATVSMNFNFVGGSGLKESIDKLQNSLTFNYYANTEVWDDRADVTDDSLKTYDKQFLSLVNQAGAPTTNQIQNYNGQSNENTIGNRITTVVGPNGDSGTISYQEFMNGFVTQTQTYFQNVLNKSKDTVKQYNNAIRQNWTVSRKYTDGNFFVNATPTVSIFGKPDTIQKIIDDVTKDMISDIESNNSNTQDRFIFFMTQTNRQYSEKAIRELIKNYKTYIRQKSQSFQNALTTITQSLVNDEQNYLQFISRANTVPYPDSTTGTDGYQEKNGFIRIYTVSGTTGVGPGSTAADTLQELKDDIKTIQSALTEYNTLTLTSSEFNYQGNSYSGKMVYSSEDGRNMKSEVFFPFSKNVQFSNYKSFKRMYMLVSQDLKSGNYERFKNAMIGNIINNTALLGRGNLNISQDFDEYWLRQAKPIFDEEDALTNAFLDEMEKNKLKNFINFTPFPSKARVMDFVQNLTPSDLQKDLIKFLGASSNSSSNTKTWNDQVNGSPSAFQSKVKLN